MFSPCAVAGWRHWNGFRLRRPDLPRLQCFDSNEQSLVCGICLYNLVGTDHPPNVSDLGFKWFQVVSRNPSRFENHEVISCHINSIQFISKIGCFPQTRAIDLDGRPTPGDRLRRDPALEGAGFCSSMNLSNETRKSLRLAG